MTNLHKGKFKQTDNLHGAQQQQDERGRVQDTRDVGRELDTYSKGSSPRV